MNVTFLASDCWNPVPGNDASGILVNNRYLFDTGYYAADNLKRAGVEPQDIEHIFFTHMHHDHYMALPQILFWYLQFGKDLSKLCIYGPKKDVRHVVDLALAFLQAGVDKPFYRNCSYPTVYELEPGDMIELPDVEIDTGSSLHPIDCICYRIEERRTGRVLGITGDTFYRENIPQTLHDCDILVHETALADKRSDINNPPSCLHSGIDISLLTARESRSKRLFVIHFPEARFESVKKTAAELSDIEVVYPARFVPYEV